MSYISPSDDIRSVIDLKHHTREILDQIHKTGRPIFLTVNGRADSVLLDVKQYEKLVQAGTIAGLLKAAEEDIEQDKTRPFKSFIQEFKRLKNI